MKKIDVSIPYREKGKRKELNFVCDFISKRSMDDFNSVMSHVASVQVAWDNIQKLKKEIEENKNIDEIQEQIDEKIKFIKSVDVNELHKKRIELAQRILRDNGITDEKFFSFKFWDECVNLTQLMDFLTTVIYKDLTDVKKNLIM